MIYGIANNPFLKENLVFKGGTVLKKVYFPDYRFSEDLDFTFRGKNFDIEAINAAFNALIEWLYEESRISLSVQNETQHDTGNYNFYLSYTGPLGGAGANKDIKVDISQDELIYNAPEEKKINSTYSDLEEEYSICCYSLGEVIEQKEKIFAKHWKDHLANQMTEIPDFNDVWRELGKHWRKFQKFIE